MFHVSGECWWGKAGSDQYPHQFPYVAVSQNSDAGRQVELL